MNLNSKFFLISKKKNLLFKLELIFRNFLSFFRLHWNWVEFRRYLSPCRASIDTGKAKEHKRLPKNECSKQNLELCSSNAGHRIHNQFLFCTTRIPIEAREGRQHFHTLRIFIDIDESYIVQRQRDMVV